MSERLPPDVVEAITAGRKIEAIKRLREARGLGLREAKDAVERYIRARPDLVERYRSRVGGGGKLLVLGIALALAWMVIRLLSR